jgi:hypothetical protein
MKHNYAVSWYLLGVVILAIAIALLPRSPKVEESKVVPTVTATAEAAIDGAIKCAKWQDTGEKLQSVATHEISVFTEDGKEYKSEPQGNGVHRVIYPRLICAESIPS